MMQNRRQCGIKFLQLFKFGFVSNGDSEPGKPTLPRHKESQMEFTSGLPADFIAPSRQPEIHSGYAT